MFNLSENQTKIVLAPIGQPIQVLASAGSGKTRVLTERVRHILKNTRKDGVIALTFTNKAAEEMQSRLNDLEDISDRCWIATIHSVAQRILDQYGHTIGLPSELHIYERDHDRKSVFLQSIRDSGFDVDEYLSSGDEKARKDKDRLIQDYLDNFSIIKRNLLSEEEAKERFNSNDSFWGIFQDYQDALLRGGGIDFDDILVYAHKILMEQPWCGQIYRAKFKHLCVDEAQDLNRAQYEFIKALCGETLKSIMMVGDPNQMIYGFNGSSSDFLCNSFVSDFSPQKFELRENYRSSLTVIRLANKLKPGSQVETNFILVGKAEFNSFRDEEAEAEGICTKIQTLLELKTDGEIEGDISLSKMVIIARTRFAFSAIEKKLDELHIPYSLKRAERQAEPTSTFGKILDLAIRVRINPKDWVDGKKLCSTLKIPPPASWGSDNLLIQLSTNAQKLVSPFANLYSNLLEHIKSLDIEKPNIPKLCDIFTVKIIEMGKILPQDEIEIERAHQELQEFRKCWTTFKRKGLGETLSAFRNALALGQVADDYNPSGLTLSTVHTMKGLEREIVFLVGMCEGVFPDYRAHTRKEQEEELNNAFVAITRAKRWIFISYPLQRMMPWGSPKAQQPSRFLKLLKG